MGTATIRITLYRWRKNTVCMFNSVNNGVLNKGHLKR